MGRFGFFSYMRVGLIYFFFKNGRGFFFFFWKWGDWVGVSFLVYEGWIWCFSGKMLTCFKGELGYFFYFSGHG